MGRDRLLYKPQSAHVTAGATAGWPTGMPLLLDYITDRVPHDLLCGICGDVMAGSAVRTPCGHHFCERDLLEWFCRAEGDALAPAQRCPQCNRSCDPEGITPARVIRNLCGELLRRCERAGCYWTGPCAEYASHEGSAQCRDGGGKTGQGAFALPRSSSNTRSNSRPRRQRLYLEQQLEDLAARDRLQRRQLAEMVQTNKELREELRRVKEESEQRLARCEFLERALLGEAAQSNLEAARTQALQEARKMRERE